MGESMFQLLVIADSDRVWPRQTQASLADSIDLDPPPGSSSTSAPSSISFLLPPPSTHISLLPLMGVSSIDPVFSDLIVSQIAMLIWWIKETNPATSSPAFAAMMQDRRRKKVVVGLGLRKMARTQGDSEDETYESSLERRRFEGIMELVATWQG